MSEIIAEIGQNHNGDMGLAKELIYAAKENGADVAKFQLFDPHILFPPTKPWFEYNCRTQLSRDNLEYLNDICLKIDIEFMTSVFDIERVEWCESINVKRYKVASRSIHDKNLINKISATQKPFIVSLGMWLEDEFPIIKGNLIGFLYCISKYPTPLTDLKFGSINFDKYIGFSDHTIGISAACIAMTKGAKIIEKHFTLDKEMIGPDHKCSMTPDELNLLSKFKDDLYLSL